MRPVLLVALLGLLMPSTPFAFLLQPPPPQPATLQRRAAGAYDSNSDSSSSSSSSSKSDSVSPSPSPSSPLPLQRRGRAAPTRKVDAATRDEALRRVGLLGLGAMVLGGAGPAGALDGGAGAMSLIDPGTEPSGNDKFFDFLQEVKIELVGAKEEFEELKPEEAKRLMKQMDPVGAEKAYFALGCYWGAEATFRCTQGVTATRVGFMGGKQEAPYYENIKDHIEALEITYVGGDATYEKLLKVCGRTWDLVDFGPRYARKIWAASNGQRALASKKGQSWSSMPVGDAAQTFFTPAKLDHQAYSKPRCGKAAAPNRQLVMNGLTRKIDHYHYASDCPTCTLPDPEEALKGQQRQQQQAAQRS